MGTVSETSGSIWEESGRNLEPSGRNLGGFGRPWDSSTWLDTSWGALDGENEKFEVLKFEVAIFEPFT